MSKVTHQKLIRTRLCDSSFFWKKSIIFSLHLIFWLNSKISVTFMIQSLLLAFCYKHKLADWSLSSVKSPWLTMSSTSDCTQPLSFWWCQHVTVQSKQPTIGTYRQRVLNLNSALRVSVSEYQFFAWDLMKMRDGQQHCVMLICYWTTTFQHFCLVAMFSSELYNACTPAKRCI